MQRSPDSQSDSTEQKEPPLLTRRNTLLLIGGGLVAFGALHWFRPREKPQEKLPAIKTTKFTSTQYDEFFTLSTLLTARPQLHPETSKRTFDALSEQNQEFPHQAAELAKWVKTHQINNVDTLVDTLSNAEQTSLKFTLHEIISAWYLGVVTDEEFTEVIAFESALMFDPVRPFIGARSYCQDAPGYWKMLPTSQSTSLPTNV